MGSRRRSGSLTSCGNAAPLGQMKPWLRTCAPSPRALTTRPASSVSSRPHTASHSGQTRYAVPVATATSLSLFDPGPGRVRRVAEAAVDGVDQALAARVEARTGAHLVHGVTDGRARPGVGDAVRAAGPGVA